MASRKNKRGSSARRTKTPQGVVARPTAAPPSDPVLSAKRRWVVQWLAPLAILLAGLMAYWNSFDGVFLLDDAEHITKQLESGSLADLFNRPTFRRRPVLGLTLALNHAIDGENPFGYHVFNLVVHLLAALTLFGLIRRTLLLDSMKGRFAQSAPILAAASTLLWVTHPLTTQAVTYVVQRSESMMGLFYLLTLYCFVRARTETNRSWFWSPATVVSCLLGMGCKPVMVTAPLAVFLYDWVFLGGSPGTMLRRSWGLYLGLAATWSFPIATGVVGSLSTPGAAGSQVGFELSGMTPWTYLLTESEVLLHYLRLALWPARLCFDYRWPIVSGLAEVGWQAAVVMSLLALSVACVRRRHWLGFAGAWFFLILAPTSSFVPIRDAAFEHRMYLPLAAVTLVVVGALSALTRWVASKAASIRLPLRQPVLTAAVVLAATGVLIARTRTRNADYHSALSLWRDVVDQRPNNVRGHYNLGRAHYDLGSFDQAAEHFERAVELAPEYVSAHLNLGACLQRKGRLAPAIAAYERVVTLDPRHWKARFSLGTCLAMTGRTSEARTQLVECIRLKPDFDRAHFNLGNVYRDLGLLEQAETEYQETVTLNDRHVSAWVNLGYTRQALNRIPGAIEAFGQALRLDPRRDDVRRAMASLRGSP